LGFICFFLWNEYSYIGSSPNIQIDGPIGRLNAKINKKIELENICEQIEH
jgi:hypothetical protein